MLIVRTEQVSTISHVPREPMKWSGMLFKLPSEESQEDDLRLETRSREFDGKAYRELADETYEGRDQQSGADQERQQVRRLNFLSNHHLRFANHLVRIQFVTRMMGIQYFSLPEKAMQYLTRPGDAVYLRKLFAWEADEELPSSFTLLYATIAHNAALRRAIDDRNTYEADWAWYEARRLYEQLHIDLQQTQAILTVYCKQYEMTRFRWWNGDAGIPFYNIDVQAHVSKYLYIRKWTLCLPSTRRLLESGRTQHECYVQTMTKPATCGVSRVQHLELGRWDWELYAWEDEQRDDDGADIADGAASNDVGITLHEEIPLDVYEEDFEAVTKAMGRLSLTGFMQSSRYTSFRERWKAGHANAHMISHEIALRDGDPTSDAIVLTSVEAPESQRLRQYNLRPWPSVYSLPR